MTADEYMCPFCVTPWKCNGPHIAEDELPEFNAAINEAYQRGREDVVQEILKRWEWDSEEDSVYDNMTCGYCGATWVAGHICRKIG